MSIKRNNKYTQGNSDSAIALEKQRDTAFPDIVIDDTDGPASIDIVAIDSTECTVQKSVVAVKLFDDI